jgi:peptidoglycan hydrolase-like protein with peptidoglycan-binding domain
MTMWKLSMAAAGAVMMFASAALGHPTMGDEQVKAVQQALKDNGLDPGTVDGRMGPKTQAALRDFQKAHGMDATGRIDMKTMQSLGVEAAPSAFAEKK